MDYFKGNFGPALYQFSKAVAIGYDPFVAHSNMASALMEIGEWDRAEHHFLMQLNVAKKGITNGYG